MGPSYILVIFIFVGPEIINGPLILPFNGTKNIYICIYLITTMWALDGVFIVNISI